MKEREWAEGGSRGGQTACMRNMCHWRRRRFQKALFPKHEIRKNSSGRRIIDTPPHFRVVVVGLANRFNDHRYSQVTLRLPRWIRCCQEWEWVLLAGTQPLTRARWAETPSAESGGNKVQLPLCHAWIRSRPHSQTGDEVQKAVKCRMKFREKGKKRDTRAIVTIFAGPR